MNDTPRTVRAARLLEAVGEDRNAAKRDELIDQLIVFVTTPDALLEDDEHQEDGE